MIVIYSPILNIHQAQVADELWSLTNGQFFFVELVQLDGIHRKGDINNYTSRPYLLQSWRGSVQYNNAMNLARTAHCCIFSSVHSLPFQKERLNLGLLSFDMSERWLKRGWLNVFSPAIFKMFMAYHICHWSKKPLFKLCCSAFAKKDQYLLGTYHRKCYKWGYFTQVGESVSTIIPDDSSSSIVSIMWCSRYLKWKHPELPILLAERLKNKGYRFVLDMYGSGEYEQVSKDLVQHLHLADVVHFMGNKPNHELMHDMQKYSIFLFTSDCNEGWGAVANESMSNGCALVASDGIGAVPYLVTDGETGCIFPSPSTRSSFDSPDITALDILAKRVEWLLQHPQDLARIRRAGQKKIREIWSPKRAAANLLQLIDDLSHNRDTSITEGPCSKA